MAKVVTITNGTGSSSLINGSYTVEASSIGYDNTSIDPSSVTIDASTNTYAFTILKTALMTAIPDNANAAFEHDIRQKSSKNFFPIIVWIV